MRKLLLVLVCALLITGSALAQTADPTIVCGTLSEAECAPLLLAQTSQPSSAAYDFSLSLALETDADGETNISTTLSGTGRYILDTAVLARLNLLNDETILQDSEALVGLLEDLLTAFDASALVTITSLEGAEDLGATLPPGFALNLYLQDGVGYADLGALNIDPTLSGVFGLDFTELLALFGPQIDLSDMTSSEDVQGQLLDVFSNSELTSRFFSVTRAADTTALDGETLAVFESSLDLGTFFSEPEVQELLREQLAADDTLSSDEIEATITGLAEGLGGTVTATQHIGVSNGYVYFTAFNADQDVDLVALAEATDSADDLDGGTFLRVMVSGTANQRDFDSISDIGLPADAQVVPLSELGL